MPNPEIQFVPVFAAGIDVVIGIVVVLVSLIGWLVNVINENAKKAPPRQANPGPGGVGGDARQADDRFQREIDDFLSQVGGKPQARRHQDRPAEVEPVEIEVVPERELWEREREERRNREISSISNRHVETQIRDSIDDKVHADIDVEADLGETTVRAPQTTRKTPRVEPGDIVKMLRDRDSVRKAVIVNEILRRPSRRR